MSAVRSPAFLIFILFVSLAGASLVGYMNSLDGSQYALTRSLSDRQSLNIGPYEKYAWPDLAVGRDKKSVSDREPGPSFLAVPFYWLGSVTHPLLTLPYDGHRPNLNDETRKQVIAYFSVVLLVAFGLAYAYELLRNLGLSVAAAASACLLVGFGTLMWKYSASFARQPAVGILLLLAVLLAMTYRQDRDRRSLTLLGVVGGLAVAHDYMAAIPLLLLVIGVVALERPLMRELRGLLLALAGFALLLGVYNYLAFGSFLTSPHQHESQVLFMKDLANNFRTPVHIGLFLNLFSFGAVPPSAMHWMISHPAIATQMGADWALKTTFKGAFIQSPFLLMASAGWIMLPRGQRPLLIYAAAVVAPWLLLISAFTIFWAPTQFDGRYLLPLVPTLAIGVAFYVERFRKLTSNLAVVALVFLALAALISVYFAWESSVTNFPPNLSGTIRWPDGFSPVPRLTLPVARRVLAESFPNFYNLPQLIVVATISYILVERVGRRFMRPATLPSPVRTPIMGGTEEILLRLRWPASHLGRVLAVGLPVAALLALVVVGPDYRTKGTFAEGPGGPPAVAAQVKQATAAEIEARNSTRLGDLVTLGKAMTDLGRAKGSYPSTNGGLQTLCTYETIDVGCALKSAMRSIPGDPLGRNDGYFYTSDGSNFVIVSKWEGDDAPPSDFACPAGIHDLKKDPLACRSSGD